MSELIVLIPHFNNPEGLIKSILSIQESIKVDLLVIDDGSKNKPNIDEIKKLYNYGNVIIEMLPENKGIEFALNHGLAIIEKLNYPFIARLDCGDLNKENKYTKQYNYLQQNPDVYLLGSWADMVDENGNYLYTLRHPVTYNKIKKQMFLNSMYVHPSVVFRTEVLNTVGKYPCNYPAAEDYAFFFKIIKNYKSENYPEALLIYEINSKSISLSKRKLQVKNRLKIIKDNFYFGFYPLYGLIRNSIIYFMSPKTLTFFKTKIYKNNQVS